MFRDSQDWRTLALVVAVYAAWAALLFLPAGLPAWLTFLLIIPVMTLHSSLQHECLHGHPFRSQAVNDVMMFPSLGLLVPYLRFKDTHLKHHLNANLCDPYDDPESWYQDRAIWEKRSGLARAVFNFNNTLLGRLLLGPAIGMTGFAIYEMRAAAEGEKRVAIAWGLHGAAMAVLLSLVALYGNLPVWAYCIAAYFGMSLLMVRTYLEHQAHERIRGRSVIIESRGPFSFLFLNNNLHAVHHAYPAVAWYRLPALFAKNRERFFAMNDGYRFAHYGEIFRRYLFRQKEPVPYPFEPVARPGKAEQR